MKMYGSRSLSLSPRQMSAALRLMTV
jgi:hypothetical protein